MKLIDRFLVNRVRSNTETRSILSTLAGNFDESFTDIDLNKPSEYTLTDPMLQSAWVNICVTVRARNIQRPTYRIYKNERLVGNGPVFELFQSPNPDMSSASLWYRTSQWFDIEGEFFWWFGPKYKSGFPKEIYVIDPRLITYMRFEDAWYYNMPTQMGTERILLKKESFIHVWEPNPWTPYRGVAPVVAMAMELEQDIAVNKEHLSAVRNSAIPKGIIKTDQKLTQEQAREIRDRWGNEHGGNKKNEKIAVLGSGAEFQSINDDLIKYSNLKDVNKAVIITKYGIPLKVVNAEDSRTALSGKDSGEQYKALWSQTLIPHLHYLESEIDTKFFQFFGLKTMRGQFDLSEIPELQVDEADLHARMREDIKVGLITINEAREMLHRDPVAWGDNPGAVGNNAPATDPAVAPVDPNAGKKIFPFARRIE